MKIKLLKLSPDAVIPTAGTEYSAGRDLYALCDEPIVIAPGETVTVHTGIALEIPENYAGLIYARSGLALREGLAPANKVGVVDSDYRGEIMVTLHNHSSEARTVQNKMRIAQLVVTPFLPVEFEETDSLNDTCRGVGGYGSTGR